MMPLNQPATQESAAHVPRLRVLNGEQLQAIHRASLDVLSHTGYHVPVEEARGLLAKAGALVKGERVYISPDMVEQALKTVSLAHLYDRQGNPVRALTLEWTSFGGLADTFYVVDPYSRRVRPFLKNDQRTMATVLDALPNIEWIQCVGQAHDVPNELQTQVAVLETLRTSTKPILAYPYDCQGLRDIYEAAVVIAGGERPFRQKPFLMCGSVPAAPLSGTDYNIEMLLTCAEYEIPLLYYACPALGANSPCSLAGTLVLANADWLAGLVMHQLKRPGAPMCSYGYTVQMMDMRTLVWSYAAPEMQMAYAAVADLAHWYGLPAWGTTMEPDTPFLDAQAGVEMAVECGWAILANVELVHNIGRSGAGKVISAEAAILADETIASCRRAVQAPPITDEAIAQGIELIAEKGPLGEYVTHEHTLQHFRELWYPKLFNRSNFDPLGRTLASNLEDRLNKRARELIETHRPQPLPSEVEVKLAELESKWYSRVRKHWPEGVSKDRARDRGE